MRLGVCCRLESARAVLDAGFDYVELSATEIAASGDITAYSGLPIDATNLFFPGSIRLMGEEATPYLDHAARAVEKAASLGVQVMVIGSGGARRAPDGVPIAAAERRFIEVAAEVAEIAATYSIQIAPESLNSKETNVGNDLHVLATGLRSAGVGYTADSYHVLLETAVEDRPTDELWRQQIPFLPTHVHISGADRAAPLPDDPMLQAFVRRLRELGYAGRFSIEGKMTESPDGYRQAHRDLMTLLS